MVNKAIITAAGFGSRFLPITKTIPKEMLPVVDKPIIHWVVQECADAGIKEVIIVSAPDEVKTFEDYFYGHAENLKTLMRQQGKMDRWKKVEEIFNLPKVTVIPEDRRLPYGNARPILSTKDLVENEDAFVVCWGDDLVLSDVSAVKQIVDFYKEYTFDGVMAVQEVPLEEISKYGAVKIKEGTECQVEEVIEKPSSKEAPTNLAEYGRFILTPEIFKYMGADKRGKDGEIWLIDAFDHVVKKGKVFCKKVQGTWYTTGDPERYLKAQVEFSKKFGINVT